MQPLAVPTLQDFIHVGPVEPAGIQARPLIGHGNGFVVKAHFQPTLGVALLRRGQIPAPDLQSVHQLGKPGGPDILGLNKGRGLFNAVNAPLGPGIGLFLNGPQAGIPAAAPATGPVLAIANEHLNNLPGHVEIPHKAQKDLQLFNIQRPAQKPLDLAVKGPEGIVGVHGLDHVPLGIVGPLPGGHPDGPLLRPKPHLPQGSGSAGYPCPTEGQLLLRICRVVAALYIQIYQRRLGAGSPQKLAHIRFGKGNGLCNHGYSLEFLRFWELLYRLKGKLSKAIFFRKTGLHF